LERCPEEKASQNGTIPKTAKTKLSALFRLLLGDH
jgi:hypothetical protein